MFSFAGLTLSDLRKSLFEGTLEVIMWAKWGSPSIPLGRGDLHITQHELCEQDSISVSLSVSIDVHNVDWSDSKFDSACVRVSELLSVLCFLIRQ